MKSILSIWKSAGNCFSDSNIPGSVFWNNFCITLLSDIAPLNAVLSLLLMHFFNLSLNLKKIFLDATLHAKPGCFTDYLLWLSPSFWKGVGDCFLDVCHDQLSFPGLHSSLIQTEKPLKGSNCPLKGSLFFCNIFFTIDQRHAISPLNRRFRFDPSLIL